MPGVIQTITSAFSADGRNDIGKLLLADDIQLFTSAERYVDAKAGHPSSRCHCSLAGGYEAMALQPGLA